MKKLLIVIVATILLFIGYKINAEPENLIGFINIIFLFLLYTAFVCVTVFSDAFESKK